MKVAVSTEGGVWPQIDVHALTASLDPSVKEVMVFKSYLHEDVLVAKAIF